MRSQTETLIDITGLLLSGWITIAVLAALLERINPLMNYREMSLGEALYVYLLIPLILLLLIVQVFGILHRLTQERRYRSPALSIARLLIPIAIIGIALLVNQSRFPGTMSSPEVRQQWAVQEFRNYDSVVNSIKQCGAIVDRLGRVNFVAPTKGQNYIVSEPGSSGHHGELTLEVVGDKATGIASLKFHIETSVGWVQLTHQNRTETLRCF
ncbi:hypothetical protein H6F89_21440 [Cyanobacteria bacterium FACHB-63]|nr:hypothetical protein [Cyanobacteria bacterium FACHB-63]